VTTAEILTLIFSGAALILSVLTIYYAGGQTKAAQEAASAANEQVAAARRQVRAADAQVTEMQTQTRLTLDALEPQLELLCVKTPFVRDPNDGRLARRTLYREEWRLYNHGDAAALRVSAVFNFDRDRVLHGEHSLGAIPARQHLPLRSSTPIRLPDFKEAVTDLNGDAPAVEVEYDTIRNESRHETLIATPRDERTE